MGYQMQGFEFTDSRCSPCETALSLEYLLRGKPRLPVRAGSSVSSFFSLTSHKVERLKTHNERIEEKL